MREGDRELVRGGGQGQIVSLLELLLVVMLLEGDHLVGAKPGQGAPQQTVGVLLINLTNVQLRYFCGFRSDI